MWSGTPARRRPQVLINRRPEELIVEVSDAGPATRAPVAGNGIARHGGTGPRGGRPGRTSRPSRRTVCGSRAVLPVGEDASRMTISVARGR